MDDIWMILGCFAVIVIGVAVIAYILFRTPKTAAQIGDVPSIDLGDMPEGDAATEADAADEGEEEPEAEATEE